MMLRKILLPKSRQLDCAQHCTSGLTLVEVLIALVLTGLILAAVYNLFGSQENTQVLVDQLSEMNQNLRIAANSILMDVRSAGYHVEGGVASSGVGPVPVNAIVVEDGGSDPDRLTILYAVPGFETNGIRDVFADSSEILVEDGCPPVAGNTVRTCGQSSPTCFCNSDLVIITNGQVSSLFQLTSDATDGPGQLEIGSSPYNNSSGHTSSGFPEEGYRDGSWRLFKASYKTYRVDRTTNPNLPSLKFTDQSTGTEQTLVEGIEDLQINPTSPNNSSYQVAITARTRKPVPGSGYRRRTITETVKVRNLD